MRRITAIRVKYPVISGARSLKLDKARWAVRAVDGVAILGVEVVLNDTETEFVPEGNLVLVKEINEPEPAPSKGSSKGSKKKA